MKNLEAIPQLDLQRASLASLTHEEVCIICRYRAMRKSARKMISDLTVEYARDFPDPEQHSTPS